jgi:hypothetical protein
VAKSENNKDSHAFQDEGITMPKTQEELLPIDGKIFETHKGAWRARVVNHQDPVGTDCLCYMVEFRLIEQAGPARNVKIWVMNAGPRVDANKYQSRIFDSLRTWLETDSADAEISVGIGTGSHYRPAPLSRLSDQ